MSFKTGPEHARAPCHLERERAIGIFRQYDSDPFTSAYLHFSPRGEERENSEGESADAPRRESLIPALVLHCRCFLGFSWPLPVARKLVEFRIVEIYSARARHGVNAPGKRRSHVARRGHCRSFLLLAKYTASGLC